MFLVSKISWDRNNFFENNKLALYLRTNFKLIQYCRKFTEIRTRFISEYPIYLKALQVKYISFSFT